MQLAKANTLMYLHLHRRKRRTEFLSGAEREMDIDYAAGKRYYSIFLTAKVLFIEYALAK